MGVKWYPDFILVGVKWSCGSLVFFSAFPLTFVHFSGSWGRASHDGRAGHGLIHSTECFSRQACPPFPSAMSGRKALPVSATTAKLRCCFLSSHLDLHFCCLPDGQNPPPLPQDVTKRRGSFLLQAPLRCHYQELVGWVGIPWWSLYITFLILQIGKLWLCVFII